MPVPILLIVQKFGSYADRQNTKLQQPSALPMRARVNYINTDFTLPVHVFNVHCKLTTICEL